MTAGSGTGTDVLDALLGTLADALARDGVHLGVGTLRLVVLGLAAVIAARVVYGLLRVVVDTGGLVVDVVRTQVENKFWQKPGKLSTALSFLVLALVYGLHGNDQPQPPGDALRTLVRSHLAHVLPLAVLTQVTLLAVFWIVFGLLLRTPVRALLEPFRFLGVLVAHLAAGIADSVGVLLLTGGNPQDALLLGGLTLMAAVVTIVLAEKARRRRALRQGAGGARSLRLPPAIGLLFVFTLIGSALAAVYGAVDENPTVSGLLRFDGGFLAMAVLVACFRFRAYMADAAVPGALPHLIDLSLAVSACAIALTHAGDSEVRLGEVPPWALTAGPPLVVAAMVLLVHLRCRLPATPNAPLCLGVALGAGLLVGPAQGLLASGLLPVVTFLPLPQP